MKGFKLIALSDLGKERIKANMESDVKIEIFVLKEDPFIVEFLYKKGAVKGLKKIIFNTFVNERAVRLSVSDFLLPAIHNVDYKLEVVN